MLLFFYNNILWLLGGFLTGLTSFGGNLFAVPFITLLNDPQIAIISGCLSGTAVFFGVFLLYIRHVHWQEVIFQIAGAILGIPIGAYFLKMAGGPALLLFASVCIFLFLIWQIISNILKKSQQPIKKKYGIGFGFLSGIMMSAAGMGGPPLALYAYLRHYSRDGTLATVNAVSVGIMIGVIPWQYHLDLYNPEIIKAGLYGGLFAFIGIGVSIPISKHINIQLFRKILLGMLLISAVILCFRAFSPINIL